MEQEKQTPEYQRARSPEQKAERMTAIMDAAETLSRQLPYHEINMGLIAKELGWSRSSLYKYASTQEDVFLSLHSRATERFIAEMLEALADAPMENAGFARLWAQVMDRQTDLLRYQDILISIIESNASLERLVEFKRAFAEMIAPLEALLQEQTGLDAAATHELYLRLIYQAPGLYSHFHCAEKTAEAMRIAGLPPITGSFVDAYADFVEMCLDAACA